MIAPPQGKLITLLNFRQSNYNKLNFTKIYMGQKHKTRSAIFIFLSKKKSSHFFKNQGLSLGCSESDFRDYFTRSLIWLKNIISKKMKNAGRIFLPHIINFFVDSKLKWKYFKHQHKRNALAFISIF